MKSKVIFNAMIGSKYCRKFEKNSDSFMNSTWDKFNKYANSKGFTIEIQGAYLGGMAWSNGSEIMELVSEKDSK